MRRTLRFAPHRNRQTVPDKAVAGFLNHPEVTSENVAFDDETEFSDVTGRDRRRAIEKRWPILLSVEAANIDEVITLCREAGIGRCWEPRRSGRSRRRHSQVRQPVTAPSHTPIAV